MHLHQAVRAEGIPARPARTGEDRVRGLCFGEDFKLFVCEGELCAVKIFGEMSYL